MLASSSSTSVTSARLHAYDEIDLRVEDLLDERLIRRDPHLPAAVEIVARLLALVLVEVETRDVALVLEHADGVATVFVDHLMHERLVRRVLLDQDAVRLRPEGDVPALVAEDPPEPAAQRGQH